MHCGPRHSSLCGLGPCDVGALDVRVFEREGTAFYTDEAGELRVLGGLTVVEGLNDAGSIEFRFRQVGHMAVTANVLAACMLSVPGLHELVEGALLAHIARARAAGGGHLT